MAVLERSRAYVTPDADAICLVEDLPGRHYRWIQRAVGVAFTSSHSFPMGAVAVRGGNLLGATTNRFRNHPRVVSDWEQCSLHAEQALSLSCQVADAWVYVARVTVTGRPALAKPCATCWSVLEDVGARGVVWTIDGSFAGMSQFS